LPSGLIENLGYRFSVTGYLGLEVKFAEASDQKFQGLRESFPGNAVIQNMAPNDDASLGLV